MSRAQETSTTQQNDAGASAPFVAGKNVITNGAFDIWQRGTSFTGGGQYTADRWQSYATQSSKLSYSQSSSVPNGFTYSWIATSSSAYSPTSGDYFMQTQRVEGYNIRSFAFGTSAAKNLTLSFWVKSSLTGTFGGAVHNAAFDKTYVFSYTISNANTWEYKTVSIAKATSGSWNTTTDVGIEIGFSLGAGSAGLTTAGSWVSGAYWGVTGQVNVVATSGATWQVTGVQLEAGPVATPFTTASGTLQGELALCQRYFLNYTQPFMAVASTSSGGTAVGNLNFPIQMRTGPSATTNMTNGTYDSSGPATGNWCFNVPGTANSSKVGTATINIYTGVLGANFTVTGATFSPVPIGINASSTSYINFNAEL